MEHQIHYGKKFYQDKKTGYWISTACPKIRAHVWVWKCNNGETKERCHIHHMDGDKSNNEISNLREVTIKDHVRIHLSDERREIVKKHAEKIRPLTKEWHRSEEGRKWHRQHALNFKFGKADASNHICLVCSKEYQTSKLSNVKFCSNACKSKWRRDNKLDDIYKTCPVCTKCYKSSKYARAKTCGIKCGGIFKSKIR